MVGTTQTRRQIGTRKALLRGTTALSLALAASAAHAQCADPVGAGGGIGGGSPTLPASSTVSGVSSLVSVLTTQNTAFLTQTSAFIGAPANPPAYTQGGGVWARGIGGTFDTNTPSSFSTTPNGFVAGTTGQCNVRTFQDYTGFQAGADIARLNIDGMNIHGGVTMGYTESTVRSNGTFGAQFQTPFIGLYGAVTKGGFFADAQLRWDFFQGVLNDPSNTLTNQRLDARSFSVTGNLGYQFAFDQGWFVEPSAGVVYSQASVDPLKTGGEIFALNSPSFAFPVTVRIKDFDSLLARGSVRVGKNFVFDQYALQPFFTASVINEFADPVQTDVATNFGSVLDGAFNQPGFNIFDQTARITSKRIGTFGQFSVGLAGQILNTGWLGYIRGDYRTGDRVEGYGISGGIRYQFTPETVAKALITKGDSPVLAPIDGPVNWTGLSAGGSVGSLWSRTTQDQFGLFLTDPTDRVKPYVAGIYAGGQIGYDYQFNNYVVGVAGDAGFTNARGGRNCGENFNGNFYNCQSNIDALYMATARVGYAWERTLLYVKGGAAFADTNEFQQENFGGRLLIFPANGLTRLPNSAVKTTSAGWTVGAGFEFALSKNWTAKAEYMHFELEKQDYLVVNQSENAAFTQAQHSGDIVKIGVNYKFPIGGAAPAVATRY